MNIVNGLNALEQAMIQLKADASSKPHFIQTLLTSEVYFEGRQEGDSFRIYEQNRSDGSQIIDLYTNEQLLRQAEGVNPDYCAHFNAATLLMLLKDQAFFVSLNHGTPDEMTFTPSEVKVMLGLSLPVDDEALGMPIAVKPLKRYPKELVRPIAAVCQRFKSAQAAYLGLVDDGGAGDTPACLVLIIDTAPSDDMAQMKVDLFDVTIELTKTLKIQMRLEFNEPNSSDDDLSNAFVQQAQPFYVQSKSNQWRKKLGLPPSITAQTF